MLEANYLSILLKPNYEKFIDTAQDVLDRNLSVIFSPGLHSAVEVMKNSPAKIDRDVAERTTVPKVIFRSFEIILILSFRKRVGMKLINGFTIKF